MGQHTSTRRPDVVIAELAARQHGVVSREQLVEAGVAAHVIDHRLRSRRLEGVHRGVYQVGPVRAPLWREMAAVLACGEGAVVSHGSAGGVLGLVDGGGGGSPAVHVTIRRGYRAPGPGVTVHRTARLSADETTAVEGIPLTAPARTILDLTAALAPRELERVVARAIREGRVKEDDVVRLLDRYPRRRGAGVLRGLLAQDGGPALTRSEAEALFLELVRRAGLPAPRVNVRIAGMEVDCHWPSAGLVVEIDGFRFHGSRAAFERDRRRDVVLAEGGRRVLRFTWRQLTREPEKVLVAVTRALAGV